MEAVSLAKEKKIDYLLAVGGGSVIDGTKFIAAAFHLDQGDHWEILSKSAAIGKALPLATVLTLPATGSESNMGSVVTRLETKEKLFFKDPLVFPAFSILDPATSRPGQGFVGGTVSSRATVSSAGQDCILDPRVVTKILLHLADQGVARGRAPPSEALVL